MVKCWSRLLLTPVAWLVQRFRFSTSVLFTAAVSLEYLTPLVPRYFLPLASVANVGKSVGLTTYIATQPVFLNSFIRCENLADINAKTQVRSRTHYEKVGQNRLKPLPGDAARSWWHIMLCDGVFASGTELGSTQDGQVLKGGCSCWRSLLVTGAKHWLSAQPERYGVASERVSGARCGKPTPAFLLPAGAVDGDGHGRAGHFGDAHLARAQLGGGAAGAAAGGVPAAGGRRPGLHILRVEGHPPAQPEPRACGADRRSLAGPPAGAHGSAGVGPWMLDPACQICTLDTDYALQLYEKPPPCPGYCRDRNRGNCDGSMLRLDLCRNSCLTCFGLLPPRTTLPI